MKKTLSVMLAVAAAGAVYAQDNTNDVIFSQSWTTEGASADNSAIGGSSFLYNEGSANALIGLVDGTLYKPWATGLDGTSSFSLSFDVTNIDVTTANSGWKDVFSLKLSDNSQLELQINKDDGNLVIYRTGGDAPLENSNTGINLSDLTNQNNFQLVVDATSNSLSIYLDGTLKLTTDWDYDLSVTGIQFGAKLDSEDRGLGGSMEINNIVLAATPEPTTATLSLLALAGLCARRRRK